jgi:DNA mismatch repair ATPase MutS
LKVFEKKEAFCFSATHFSLPSTIQSATHYRIRGLRVDKTENLKDTATLEARLQELHRYMDYSLEKIDVGAEPPRSALMIATFLGVDKNIINCAKNLMQEEQ